MRWVVFLSFLCVLSYYAFNTLLTLEKSLEVVSSQQDGILKDFQSLLNASSKFAEQVKFWTTYNRIAVIAGLDTHKQQQVIEHAQAANVIMHNKVFALIDNFLAYKSVNGSGVEKKLYAMSRNAFIRRLITQRPLMFMNATDDYLLRDGVTKGKGGFELIGTVRAKAPLVLKDYLSYDEMQIAALLGAVVPTYFINDGDRYNEGVPGKAGTFEEQGVYVGLVGARFERPGVMEWEYIMITKEQNTADHGYGLSVKDTGDKLDIWRAFYDCTFPTYQEAYDDVQKHGTKSRYLKCPEGYFDTLVFKKRIRAVVEPFLCEAHQRGQKVNKKVYVHMVGLGLGVWQKLEHQAQLVVDTCADIVRDCNLAMISDLNFSWFKNVTLCGGVPNGGRLSVNNNNIIIHFSQRNPAAKLTGEDSGKLLVACYAWDGNSYPGNEYWVGALTASGDPAAACCSTITELQNPEINPWLLKNDVHTWGSSVV